KEPVDEKYIRSVVEMKELKMLVHGGGTNIVKVNFKYVSMVDEVDTISRREFLERQFNYYKKEYKANVEKWGGKNEAVYELVYPDLDKPLIVRGVPYLSSHLSLIDGFLGLETTINDNEDYCFRIKYSKDVLNEDKIWEVLNRKQWTVKTTEGEIQVSDPKFSFTNKGITK
ncbi:MAG: 4Fe-4S binding protein, partial [Bacteroidales bacterium]|nr:4Fe-4S binding protein [Bacteroidales bacterium]